MSVNQHQGTILHTGNVYHEVVTTTNLYVEKSFGFPASQLSFVNDSLTDPCQISFDGATLHYTLPALEHKDLPGNGKLSVFVKSTAGGATLRITAI
jgi:hypothetical protein